MVFNARAHAKYRATGFYGEPEIEASLYKKPLLFCFGWDSVSDSDGDSIPLSGMDFQGNGSFRRFGHLDVSATLIDPIR